MSFRRTAFRTAIALAVSGILLASVLRRVDLGVLAARVADFRIAPLGLALFCATAVLLLRAQRFYALAERADFGTTIAAVAVQNFLVRVTPFRVGELGLPVVLARHAGEPLVRSLVNVLLVRLVELWMLLLVGAGATAAFVGPRGGSGFALPLGLLIGVTAAVFTFRGWLGGLARLARRVGDPGTPGLRGKVRRTLDQLLEVLADSGRLSLGSRLRLGLGTLAIAGFQSLLYWSLLALFGVGASVVQVLVGGTAAQFAAAAPVPSVGSVGPLEAAWVAGFTWVGIGREDAVVTAVGCQVVTLGFAAVFACVAWLWLGRRGRPPPGPGQWPSDVRGAGRT